MSSPTPNLSSAGPSAALKHDAVENEPPTNAMPGGEKPPLPPRRAEQAERQNVPHPPTKTTPPNFQPHPIHEYDGDVHDSTNTRSQHGQGLAEKAGSGLHGMGHIVHGINANVQRFNRGLDEGVRKFAHNYHDKNDGLVKGMNGSIDQAGAAVTEGYHHDKEQSA